MKLFALLMTLMITSCASTNTLNRLAPMKSHSRLIALSANGLHQRIICESEENMEAPNWSPDGKWIIFNLKDGLYRVPAEGGKPEIIPIEGVKRMSNDHVISPDGKTLYYSEKGVIYSAPIEGGTPTRLSSKNRKGLGQTCWLHGISPDGKTLVFCGIGADWKNGQLWTMPVEGGQETQIYDIEAHNDGPDYAPDGEWIYFNSDLPGHAQIYRISVQDDTVERLTHDQKVNWFPHPSPDGKWLIYMAYPEGTVGHPGDISVSLYRMKPDGSESSELRKVYGGQGCINSPSWSPNSKEFAFVEYKYSPPTRNK